MKTKSKRLWHVIIATIFLAGFTIGCKDEDVGVVGKCPLVVSTNPLNGATGVPLDQVITVTFNEPMNPATINSTSFIVTGSIVEGTVSYTGSTASFTPASPLIPNHTYTARVTSAVKDVMGNALQTDYIWTFSTGAIVAPTVIATDPINNATGVALNKIVTATFSVPMDPLTIAAATYTIKQGPTLVAGAVSYTGSTATFTPTIDFLPNTVYTGTITTGAKNVPGTALGANFVWTFTTGASAAPTVTLTDPLNNATSVLLNKVVTATFSEPMDPLTITGTTFTIKQGATPIAGAVTYSGSTATFTPSVNFLSGITYTATITTGAKNPATVPLANNYIWTFTTVSVAAPTVVSTDPLNNATGVVLNKIITADFSEPMDPLTITATTFTLKKGATVVSGIVTYSGSTATFTPTVDLLSGTIYTATITTGAKNVPGVGVAVNYVWTFTTVQPPTVVSTDPINNATGVALNKIITATFSEAMNAGTINGATFTLTIGGAPVAGNVTYSGITATFTPSTFLLSDGIYVATINTGAKNLAVTSLANDYVWTFSTVPHLGPLTVDLKSVGRFGIISGVGVSNNAGFSVINNLDVGISPGVRTSVTGFPPATIVNGAIYASDDIAPPGTAAMLTQAKQDLTDAYLFAEAATAPAPVIVAGDLGGLTLAPGIYKSTSTLLIQGGNLTLDAQGDANAVWIFQIASAFTTVGGAGGNVILSGGAQAKNIFWQVGSSATIGDFTSFKGNVLALTSITMNSGANAVGRMLARNGSVVLTSTNIINKP